MTVITSTVAEKSEASHLVASAIESAAASTIATQAPRPSTRIVSVDALRGFDMFWIIGAGAIVSALDKMSPNPVVKFLSTQLTHVTWEGFHAYDLIFPLFLFIVGVSMVFSLDKALAEGGRARVIGRICRRSLLLYVLGVIYSGGLAQPWPEVRLGGVLQRIAACYLCAGLIYCFTSRPKMIVAICSALLVGYWALVSFVPFPNLKLERPTVNNIAKKIDTTAPTAIAAAVPERIAGVYEEGRNLTNYVDFRYLPGKKAQIYYINEGLLSTLPAIALPLFGALAGLLLKRSDLAPRRKVFWLLAAGLSGIALGLAWSWQFPIIKRIWTSSFVMLTAGYSAVLLAVFYEVIDVRGWRRWCQPFVWVGANAITIYFFAHLLEPRKLAALVTGGDVNRLLNTYVAPGLGGLVTALVGLLLVVLFARFLYKRNIFLRV